MKRLLLLLPLYVLTAELHAAINFNRISVTQGSACATVFPLQFIAQSNAVVSGSFTVSISDSAANPPVFGSSVTINNSAHSVDALFNLTGLASGMATATIVENAGPTTTSFPFEILPCSGNSGVQVRLYGAATTAPARTWQYVVSVINFGATDTIDPISVDVDGLPVPPEVVVDMLNDPRVTPNAQGLTVNLPAGLVAGMSADVLFELTPDFSAVGSTYPLGAHFTSGSPGGPASLPFKVVASMDPNDKTGPPGAGVPHFITGDSTLAYNIVFENDPMLASAPAQQVGITDQLDPAKVDLSSFLFGPITFGSQLVIPPPAMNPFTVTVLYDVDHTPGDTSDDVDVQIDGSLDVDEFSPTYGQITWTFQTFDQFTGMPPSPDIGFLPPDVNTPEGQGSVAFTVSPQPGLVTGNVISNQASIVFDLNPGIDTPTWTNTIDKNPPTITCPLNRTVLTPPSLCTLVVNNIGPASTSAAVGIKSITWALSGATSGSGVGNASGQVFNKGVTTVTYTITDMLDRTATCHFTVTVLDMRRPVFANCPGNITVQTGPGRTTCDQAASWTPPTASDNCGVTSFTWDHSPGDLFPVGVTTVTYTASDAANNTTNCHFTVTVQDTTPPVIANCPADVTVQTGLGGTTCDQVASWTPPTASDNCGVTSFTSDHNPGDPFPVGTTTVTYTARDAANNTAICSFTVTVQDTTPPMIALIGPNPMAINTGAVFTDPGAMATDNCGTFPISISGTVDANTPGTYALTYSVLDFSGNAASATRPVIVAVVAGIGETVDATSIDPASALVLDGGTLQNDSGADVDVPNEVVLLADSTIAGNGKVTLSGPVVMEKDITLKIETEVTISKEINDKEKALKLTKEGAEKLKLMAENKFDRGVDLKEGTLVLGDDKCLGTGTLACKGGDLEALGERKIPNPVEFEGDTKISGDKLTFAEEAKAKGECKLDIWNETVFKKDIKENGVPAGITKDGSGKCVMEGKCECTMDTKVNGGTLEVTKTGSIPDCDIKVEREVKTNPKPVIKGKGTVKKIQLKKGAKIKPGGSPGTLTVTGDLIWEGDTSPDPDPGSYQWDINDATGAEGADAGWGLIDVQGALNITATAADPFTLELVTLTLADVPGSMVNFDPTTSYTWRIVRTQGGINGFGAGVISIDPAGFANMTDGTFSLSLENSGHDLILRYIAGPIISSFSPLSGPVGTEVTIEGTGLDTVTEVQFHGTPAVVVTPVSATSIKAVVPLGATTGPITVISPGGTGTSPASFKVLPKITSFTPTSAAVGETVTITGTTFTGATSVKFNTISATFTVDSDTQITATVPVGATTGTISVTTTDGTGTSPVSFGVLPRITSFTPSSAPVGARVTVIGNNFTGTTSVKFNGASATFTVVSDTQITATVPTAATTGRISVTTPDGTAVSTSDFTIIPSPIINCPQPNLVLGCNPANIPDCDPNVTATDNCPSAYLLVSSVYSDAVKRYDGTTGTFIDTFASGGGLNTPEGLAFGPDGNLYVSSVGTDAVERYNGTTGAFIDTFTSGGGLSGPVGLVFGSDGNLYVSSYYTSDVKRYNGTTGVFIDTFASGGGLSNPQGLVFGPDANLYVSSRSTHDVKRYNGTTGAFIDIFASGGGLSEPVGLVFGPDANLYVSSYGTSDVKRYNGTTGVFIDTFASGGGLSAPAGLVFGADANLYVCSFGTDAVKRYNGTTGAFIDTFASGGGLQGPTFLIFTPPPQPPHVTCAKVDEANGCVRTRTLTYTAVDACNNSATCTQVITWTVDTIPPTFDNCPSDLDLACNPTTIPECDTGVTASDDCGPATVTCSFSDTPNPPGTCRHTRTITYVATDSCGNQSTCVQHITWKTDTTGPALSNCPAPTLNLGCNPAAIPDCDPNVGAIDNCEPPILLVSSYGTAEVKRYNATTGAFIDTFASAGGLDIPYGLGFGPDGNLYVVSQGTDEVKRYNRTTGALMDSFASGGWQHASYGLVFGPDGNLYVSSGTDEVKRYNGTTGAFMDNFVSASSGGLNGPWGLVFGPDGNLYASSYLTDDVKRYNGTTGAFIDTFASGGGLDAPFGLVFGPDGNLYVSSAGTDEVKRYEGSTGAFIDTFASGGLNGPQDLAFGPDGNLYVNSYYNNEIKRYNGTTGTPMGTFVSAGSGGLNGPTFLIFTPTAQPTPVTCAKVDAVTGCAHTRTLTYTAVDACNNTNTCTQVITWTVDTTAPVLVNCPAPTLNLGCNPAIDTIPTCSSYNVTATDDCGAAVSCSQVQVTNGCVRVRTLTYTAIDACNNSNTCAQVITWTEDTIPPVFTNCPPSNLNLGCNPASIPDCDPNVGASDNCGPAPLYLLVSSANTHEVKRYNGTTGASVDAFASGGGLNAPFGLGFGPDGNLYVSSINTPDVKRYHGTTGAFIDNFATGGGVNSPVGLVFGLDGNLYVSSAGTDDVKRYNGATGAFLDNFAFAGGLRTPYGLVFGPDGNLYVSSAGTDEVKRYDGTTGALIDTFASGGGLSLPTGLVFGPDGNLYVSSGHSGTVKRYNGTTGAFIDTFASGGGLSSPYGLVFGPDGNLYVSNENTDDVKRYNGTTGVFIDNFASGGGLGGPKFLIFTPPGQPPRVTCAKVDTAIGCAHTRTITYTAVDACNNSNTCTQVITWTEDTTGPTITCAGSKNVECGTAWSFDVPSHPDDACGTNRLIVLSTVTNALCGNTYSATRTWAAVDECNNTNTCSQTVTVVYPMPYAFITLAGSAGQIGTSDGTGSAARFDNPRGVAVDSAGNVYVADTSNQTIRKITLTGAVTTWAGSPGQIGSDDGTGSLARFNNPYGVAVDGAGNVYVADVDNHTIRRITSGGVVTTLAGSAGQSGSADGTGSAARFFYPQGVAADAAGNVYVMDTYNQTIRKITSGGVVTTLAGSPGNTGSADGSGSAARFYYAQGVAVDSAGNVYVADSGNSTIRKISPVGGVTTLAGSPGQNGSVDGTGSTALFHYPYNVAVDSAGNVYVTDSYNHSIRKISPAGDVTTPAGLAEVAGSADGTGTAARFRYPNGVAADVAGTVYVADSGNHTIRKGGPASPILTCAANKTVNCGTAWSFDSPAASDTCSGANLAVTILSTVTNGLCPQAITRTWQAIDPCGHSNTCSQTVTVVDTTPPTFTRCPTTRHLVCNPFTIPDCDPSPANIAATDACSTPIITCAKSDLVSGDGCIHDRTLTYTATDACGNVATCVQHIIWTTDTTPPYFTRCPSDVDLGTNPPSASIPVCNTRSSNVEAEDICSTPVITCVYLDATNDCTRTRTFLYTATDACGNSANCLQVVTWHVPASTILSIVIQGSSVVLSWSQNCNMFVLEQTSELNSPNWTPVSEPAVVVDNRNTVTVPITVNTFYRLRFP